MLRRRRIQASKRTCQLIHARRRARERYGLDLNFDHIRELIAQIQDGRAVTFLGRESCTRTHWAVEHEGRQMVAVYDKSRQTICTFLPPEAIETYPVEREVMGNVR